MRKLLRTTWFLTLFSTAFAGFILGSCFQSTSVADKSPYKELEKFSKVLHYIEANYVQAVDTKTLIEGAIKGMLETLDPHSAYLPPEVYKEMKVETSGKFGGLGIEVGLTEGYITVVTPIDETPAFRAGIKAGDKIVQINGKSTKNLSMPEAVTLMRGKIGESIDLVINRKSSEKLLKFKLKRESIKMQSVKAVTLPQNLAYFRLSSFQERTSDDLAREIEKELKKKPAGLILDLRGNPGGLLDQATRVVSLFVDEGPIVYTLGRDKSKKEIENAQRGRKMTGLPLVVLLDGSSASASEIVAGALQDYGRAIIAGQQSFGKGSVQTIVPVGDEAGLKVTIARYYTPSGRSIQVKGITPDVLIDAVDPKTLEAAQKAARRVREGDLERHFDNEEDSTEDKAKTSPIAAEKEAPDYELLPLEERVKKDFMVIQAQGILKTMTVVRSGLKKPNFKLEEDPKASDSTKSL